MTDELISQRPIEIVPPDMSAFATADDMEDVQRMIDHLQIEVMSLHHDVAILRDQISALTDKRK